MVPDATMACQDDQMCAGLKIGIYGAIHGVQALWDEKLSTEEWFSKLLDEKVRSTRLIESECSGRSDTYDHPEIFSFSTDIVTGHRLFYGPEMGRQVFYIVERE